MKVTLQIKQPNQELFDFVLCFLVGGLFTLLYSDPFNQPIFADRAYLLYMSQEISRNASVYHSTTFGYTPLSILFVGYIIKLGAFFGMDSVTTSRLFALFVYGVICGFLFKLLKMYFKAPKTAMFGVLLFVGLDAVRMLASINAEPKLFVLLCSLLGLLYLNRKNYLLAGLFFSFSAMSWQPSGINVMIALVSAYCYSNGFLRSFLKICQGVLLGALPVILYLTLSQSWEPFIDQTILRKFHVEGAALSESPFKWLFTSIWPWFYSEALYFVFGFIGLVMVLKKVRTFAHEQKMVFMNLFFYSLAWCLINTIEFQGGPDFIPLLIPLMVFLTYSLETRVLKSERKTLRYILVTAILLYAFQDSLLHKRFFTYKQQRALMEKINTRYGDPVIMGFEAYYVLQEKPISGKLMRNMSYEDYFTSKNMDLCSQTLSNGDYIIVKDLLITQPENQRVIPESFKERIKSKLMPIEIYLGKPGSCMQHILGSTPIDTLTIPLTKQRFPFGKEMIERNYYVFQKSIHCLAIVSITTQTNAP